MTFHAIANKDGTLSFDTRNAEWRWKSWAEKNGGKEITIKQEKGKRKLGQNRFLWAVYTIIADAVGHSPEEIHRIMKGVYLPPKIVKIGGKEYKIAGSTTELNTSQFAEYTERVVAQAADLGLIIPTKEEIERMDIANL
jgi:hypothetical protein